jgi:anaerobic magnesium-protoporphyrin IX monomethyl ester cyclase
MMRILLLQAPVANRSPHAHLSPPLGLAYVAARLLEEGHRVELIDLNLTGLNPARVTAALKRFAPDLVGISSHTETYPNALALARIVKERDASTPVLLGGPHASILPEAVLAEPDVDFVAMGEGEATAAELVRALESGADAETLRGIAGLGHKVAGTPELNVPREPLAASDIGLPARQLLSLEFYEDAHNILVARGGCPYRCPFCSASYLWGGRRRMRPVADVMSELDMVVRDYGAGHVFFVDDILTLDRRWLGELLTALEAHGTGVTWGCATRVDRVDEELLRRMAKAGCTGIQFGVESGAQEILDSVKGIEKETALDAVRWAVAAGINVSCSFMIPFPEDTEATLAETRAFMREMQDAGGRLLISYTTPFPGTKFHDEAAELGLRILTDDWSRYDCKHMVMETRHLRAGRIEQIAAEIAADLGMVRTA